jgi:hypothetical protein
MDIESLTVKQVKELCALVEGRAVKKAAPRHPYEVGKNYLIRGVTLYYTGRLVEVTQQEIVLEDASWIPDTGRFNKALKTGVFNEVEPYPAGRVIVGRGTIADAKIWDFDLPRSEK